MQFDTLMAQYSVGDFLLIAFVLGFMPLFATWSGASLKRVPLDHARRLRRYWQTIVRGWFSAAAVLIVWFVAVRPWPALGLDWPVGTWGLYGLAFDAVLTLAFVFDLTRVPKLAGERLDRFKARMDAMHILPHESSELPLFFVMALTAGVWEELLYRGFLMWFLQPFAGMIGAIVISSALFGLGHIYQGWKGVLRTGAVGLVFAIAYALTHSLWWLMAAHAVLDIFGGLAAWRIFVLHRSAAAEGASA